MTRDEQIKNSIPFENSCHEDDFIAGAKWADANPRFKGDSTNMLRGMHARIQVLEALCKENKVYTPD